MNEYFAPRGVVGGRPAAEETREGDRKRIVGSSSYRKICMSVYGWSGEGGT